MTTRNRQFARSLVLTAAAVVGLWLLALHPMLDAGQATGPAKAPQEKKDPALEKTIHDLIKLLGNDSFEQREAATKKLAAIGEPAQELLAKAAKDDPDAEVRARAQLLVRQIRSLAFNLLRSFTGHAAEPPKGQANRVLVTDDGKRVISAGGRFLRYWDLESGKQLLAFGESTKPYYAALAISPDSKWIVAGGDAGIIRIFDLENGKELRSWAAHPGGVRGIVLLGGAKQALTGGWDLAMHVWDLDTGKEIRSFEGVREGLRCLTVSPDGKLVAAGHSVKKDAGPGQVRIWNVETGKEVLAFQGQHKGDIMSVAFAPDGKTLLSAGFDNVMILWDVASGKELKRFYGQPPRRDCAVFSSDGKRIIACGDGDGKSFANGEGTVRIWDVASGKILYESDDVGRGIMGFTMLPGNRFLTASRDGIVRLWECKQ